MTNEVVWALFSIIVIRIEQFDVQVRELRVAKRLFFERDGTA
jgi:hypothetical protein